MLRLDELGRGVQAIASTMASRLQPAWIARAGGDFLWVNAEWTAVTGLSGESSAGSGWRQALHADDAAATQAALEAAAGCGLVTIEHRLEDVRQPGLARWFHTEATPLPDAHPSEPLWLGISTDVHEVKMLRQRERAIQARAGDLMMFIRSTARRTAAACSTVEQCLLHLDSRLDAIARLDGAAAHHPEAGLDVATVISDALFAYGAQEGEEAELSGPAVTLAGRAGMLFGLVAYELAMNAAKHGALTTAQGRVTVDWRLMTEHGTMLYLEWLEAGGPFAKAASGHAGYGTELIIDVLPRETGAETSLVFRPEGVSCTIDLPCVSGDGDASGRQSRRGALACSMPGGLGLVRK